MTRHFGLHGNHHRHHHHLLLPLLLLFGVTSTQAFSFVSRASPRRCHSTTTPIPNKGTLTTHTTTCQSPLTSFTSAIGPLYVHSPDAASVPQNYTAASTTTTTDKNNHPLSTTTAKTCIVLNTNARSVTNSVVQAAKAVLGEPHVYVTQSQAQAQRAANQILLGNYQLVIPVGGDGTLSRLVNLLCAAWLQQQQQHNDNDDWTYEQAMQHLPAMAYIPLGTGNGVGSVVGNLVQGRRLGILPSKTITCQRLTETLQRLQSIGEKLVEEEGAIPTFDHDEYERVDMPMMQVTTYHSNKNDQSISNNIQDDNKQRHATNHDDLCFFAGVGFDSLMLNDFKRIKAWSIRTGFLTRTLSSVTGYCVALIVRTLPQTVWQGRHNIHVQVTTPHVNSTLWVDHRRGDVVRTVHNSLLYDGITGILAAGTSPFYGGGLRLFPFARLTTDQMHLRVGRIHPLTGFFNIPQIFAGTYRDKSDRLGCLDFIGDDFQVQVEPASNVLARHNNRRPVEEEEEEEEERQNDGTTKGYPFQHSGESVGHVERFRLRVVKEPVRFICLRKKMSLD